MRPQAECDTDWSLGCMSRAVCYTLDHDTGMLDLAWEFEFPDELNGSPLNASVLDNELYNMNGGSLRKIGENDWSLSFTQVSSKHYNDSSWVFGLKLESNHGPVLTSISKLPRCHIWSSDNGNSGSYRINPIKSINGESKTR